MAQKEITLLIDRDGKVKIDMAGFEGEACSDVARLLERALGTASKTTRKPAMPVRVRSPAAPVRR